MGLLKGFGALLSLICAIALSTHSAFAQTPTESVSVDGVVVDQAASTITGAEVVLKSASLTRNVPTDLNGRFHFDSLPRESVTLTISAKGFEPITRKLDPAAAATTQLRFVLAPAPIQNQVTVTAATRTETLVNDTAAKVVILNSKALTTTAAVTLDDALRQVAGFSLFRRSGSRTANPTAQGVSLRGLGGSGASRALVLADGVPLNDPFGGWIYWDRVPRESISNVEVLEGGASHLYGSTALAGLIDISTKRASNNHVSLS